MDEKNEHKLPKVTTGAVTVNNTITPNKILRLFLKEDLSTVAKHMVEEVLLPKMLDAVYYALSDGLSMAMGREPQKRGRNSSGTRVSYSSYSKSEDKPLIARPGLKLDPSDVTFETRADAEDTLCVLCDALEQGDEDASVSLADFLARAGIPNDNYTYQKWGWTNLSTAEIKRLGDGSYYIKFPRLEQL